MMFHSPKLRVVLATVHVPLRDVPRLLTRDLILGTLHLDRAGAAVLRRRRIRGWPWPGSIRMPAKAV